MGFASFGNLFQCPYHLLMKKDTSWKNFRYEYMYLSFLLTFAEIGRLYIIERQVLFFFFSFETQIKQNSNFRRKLETSPKRLYGLASGRVTLSGVQRKKSIFWARRYPRAKSNFQVGFHR